MGSEIFLHLTPGGSPMAARAAPAFHVNTGDAVKIALDGSEYDF